MQKTIYIGIDWADQKHDIHILAAPDISESHVVEHDVKTLVDWFKALVRRYSGSEIVICLEQSKGALTNILCQLDGLQLFPINPKQLARFREAIYPSGAKTDPRDAQLLAEFILNHRGLLRAAPENQPEVEALDLATRQRRKTVDQITKETQKITQLLKEIYPAFLKVFPSLTDTALEFLKRFPSVEALHKSKGHYIQEKLSQCKRGNDEQLQHYTQLLTESVTLEQSMLAEIHTIQIKASIAVITTLRKAVKEFDKVIARLYVNQDKSGIFDSLPGAGKALAPRLLVSFALPACQSVQQLQCYSGIAPIIRASGNSRRTCFRVGRPKFLHQSILEFADRSVRYSTWANAYFKYKQKNGESTNSILRKIAFKWMRIIWRCLENNQNYDEQKYIQTLKKNNVPYIN